MYLKPKASSFYIYMWANWNDCRLSVWTNRQKLLSKNTSSIKQQCWLHNTHLFLCRSCRIYFALFWSDRMGIVVRRIESERRETYKFNFFYRFYFVDIFFSRSSLWEPLTRYLDKLFNMLLSLNSYRCFLSK